MTPEETRSAHLLFGEELALGELTPGEVDHPLVEDALRQRPVPSWVSRRLQLRALAAGRLSYEQGSAEPMARAREAVLGADAAGRPRVLVRLADPPAPDDDPARLQRFAEVAAVLDEHGIPWLTPRLIGDVAVLAPGDGLRRYAELAGAADVVCAGPESVATMGFHPTPLWRGKAVYLPAYAPLAGPAHEIRHAVERLLARRAALWVPVVVDWAADAGAGGLHVRALAETLRGLARSWDEFLAAVRASAAI